MVYSISTTLLKYLETNPFESMLPAGLYYIIPDLLVSSFTISAFPEQISHLYKSGASDTKRRKLLNRKKRPLKTFLRRQLKTQYLLLDHKKLLSVRLINSII